MILLLARRSVTEAVADGVPHAVIVWLVALAIAAPAIAGAGFGAGGRVVGDLGLGGTGLLVGLAGIALGIRQVGVEIRTRRAIGALARPVPLEAWIAGRVVGTAIVLAGTTASAGIGAVAIAAASGGVPEDPLGTLTTAWARGVVLAAAAMAASTLARPALAALAAGVLWIATFLADDAAAIAGVPLLAAVVPVFDGGPARSVVHALAWAAVYAAIATWGVGRSDRG